MTRKNILVLSLLLSSFSMSASNSINACNTGSDNLAAAIEETGCFKNPLVTPLPQKPLIDRYVVSSEAFVHATQEVTQKASEIKSLRPLVGDKPIEDLTRSFVQAFNSVQKACDELEIEGPKNLCEKFKKLFEEEKKKAEENKAEIARLVSSLNPSIWNPEVPLEPTEKEEEGKKLLTGFKSFLEKQHPDLLSSISAPASTEAPVSSS